MDKTKRFVICYDIRFSNKTYQTIANQLSCSKQYISKIARIYGLQRRIHRRTDKAELSIPFVFKTEKGTPSERQRDNTKDACKKIKVPVPSKSTPITALQLKMIYWILTGKSISKNKKVYLYLIHRAIHKLTLKEWN